MKAVRLFLLDNCIVRQHDLLGQRVDNHVRLHLEQTQSVCSVYICFPFLKRHLKGIDQFRHFCLCLCFQDELFRSYELPGALLAMGPGRLLRAARRLNHC